jgi:hypothetical protein
MHPVAQRLADCATARRNPEASKSKIQLHGVFRTSHWKIIQQLRLALKNGIDA